MSKQKVDTSSSAETDSSNKVSKSNSKPKKKRSYKIRKYPQTSFEDASLLGREILRYAPTGKIRRMTLFEKMNRSPQSGGSRALIINSGKYGISEGSYKSEHLELTADGMNACMPGEPTQLKRRAEFELAIQRIELFNHIYEKYKTKRLPAPEVLRDSIVEFDPSLADETEKLAEIIQVNLNHLGLLREIGGAETLITIDHALEALPRKNSASTTTNSESRGLTIQTPPLSVETALVRPPPTPATDEWSTTCFYIAPIGEDGSEQRQHSDLFLQHIVKPALSGLGLTVIRADQIADSGLITTKVLEFVRRSRLCVADLSFMNANVFYELALRHASRLPTVQIMRKRERIPFDINQVRTVVVDDSSIYSLVPKLQTYQNEIRNMARTALEDPSGTTNPINIYYPEFWD